MQVSEVLKKTTEHFKKKQIETARLDAELLIAEALEWPRIRLYSEFEYPLSEEEVVRCREFVQRRSQGEPVAYIVGYKGFYKDSFKVTPDVLIPRPETECLVEKALERVDPKRVRTLVDLGTGSGCLGLSLLKELSEAELAGVDISEKAIEVAEENARWLGLSGRSRWVTGDVEEVIWPKADLIVANPPYIERGDEQLSPEVQSFEPALALFAEDRGLAKIFSWSQRAASRLNPGGWFFCEFGIDQEKDIAKYLSEQELFSEVQFYPDLAGIPRFFEAHNG